MSQELTRLEEMGRYDAINDIQKDLAALLYEAKIKQTASERKSASTENELKIMKESARTRAREVCIELLDSAMDIDKNIRLLLKDPRVLEKYEYNGKWFNPKVGHGFSRVLDGKHSLTTLRENLGAYFNYFLTDEGGAVENILEASRMLLKEAEAVLENWKESGGSKISVTEPRIMGEAVKQHRTEQAKVAETEDEKAGAVPLAEYEKKFDREMEEFLKRKEKGGP